MFTHVSIRGRKRRKRRWREERKEEGKRKEEKERKKKGRKERAPLEALKVPPHWQQRDYQFYLKLGPPN